MTETQLVRLPWVPWVDGHHKIEFPCNVFSCFVGPEMEIAYPYLCHFIV